MRISFDLELEGPPFEYGLPKPVPNPPPRPKRSPGLRPGDRLLFGIDAEVIEGEPERFGATELGWVQELPTRLPFGTCLCSIELLDEAPRYAIDVLAGSDAIESVVETVRLMVEPYGTGFSVEPFGLV